MNKKLIVFAFGIVAGVAILAIRSDYDKYVDDTSRTPETSTFKGYVVLKKRQITASTNLVTNGIKDKILPNDLSPRLIKKSACEKTVFKIVDYIENVVHKSPVYIKLN